MSVQWSRPSTAAIRSSLLADLQADNTIEAVARIHYEARAEPHWEGWATLKRKFPHTVEDECDRVRAVLRAAAVHLRNEEKAPAEPREVEG